jgi:alpha-galactosidase
MMMKLSHLGRGVFPVITAMIIAVGTLAATAQTATQPAVKPSAELPAVSETAARLIYEKQLARTPPMGWNSWNIFAADINEQIIMQIADAMVASGMKDAGYEYLVLDDGWMAKNRDSAGNLAADPVKFPNGMKAVGDYLHRKGLKFGIYEDRGYLTCQKLPGSFQHEEADMNIFASWGVDYIKMDSCFAEKNGRLTSDHYTLFKNCIIKSGRPMVLSISDFGNGGWAWDGKDMAHLWRTSGDIGRSMNSVYNCAETSGGDRSIHPAFNGLWQFAGPGHWNDPDMLQVGNLRTDLENRAHFSLWCILAAPLMAGNDLRSMSDSVKQILTAREVIAVNQDPRGIQGYKVYNQGARSFITNL